MTLIDEMSVETGLGRGELQLIVLTAPKRYKRYTIPKRSGGRREIAQPAREVKVLQRFLHDRVLNELPVHSAAAAYVKGTGIRANAEVHRHSRVIMKLDFKDFFPSIKTTDWARYLQACPIELLTKAGLNEPADRAVATRLLFWGQGGGEPKCLSIGAPTSPMLSNIVMYPFDVAVSEMAERLGAKYSRYADDVTLSSHRKSVLEKLEVEIRKLLRELSYPRLKINEDKRGIFTMGQRRMVTGVVITPQRQVSIGRQRKRMIHSLLHRFSLNALSEADTAYLKGMIGFANAIEPDFLSRLRLKYGNEPLNGILKLQLPRKGPAPFQFIGPPRIG